MSESAGQISTNDTPAEGAPVVAADGAPVQVQAAGAPVEAGAPVRPEGVADEFWDPASGLKVTDLIAKYGEATGKLAEFDAAKAELPATADDYKLDLPADFKAPEGMDLHLDADSEEVKGFRAVAKDMGLSQGQFTQLLGLEARMRVQMAEDTKTSTTEFVTAQKKELGANADARIEAARNWLASKIGADDAAHIFTALPFAKQIVALEKLQAAASTDPQMQGSGTAPPAKPLGLADQLYGAYPPQPRR